MMPLPPLRMGSKPTSKLSPLPLPKGNELPAESATSTFGEKHASAASSSRESTFGQKHASVASSSGESQLIEPRRFALRYHPPQLIMEYLDSSKGGRVRHRCWKMDKVTNSAHALEAAKQIAEKLATVVRPGSVSVHQLDHLLKMLCVNSEKEDEELRVAQEKLADAEMGDFTDKTILTKDLNAVSTDELERAKAAMEVAFSRNSVRPGDPNFQYDVQMDFEPEEDNEWDEGDDDDD